jgi:superfamily II DNA helicase RecQ
MLLETEAAPRTKEQLLAVKGFGNAKVEKYGEDIINIVNSVID